MTDISKCHGNDCPKKDQCFRYTAPHIKHQSFFAIPPYSKESKVCAYFWNNRKKEENEQER